MPFVPQTALVSSPRLSQADTIFLARSAGVHAICNPARYLTSDTRHAPLAAATDVGAETSGRVLARHWLV